MAKITTTKKKTAKKSAKKTVKKTVCIQKSGYKVAAHKQRYHKKVKK